MVFSTTQSFISLYSMTPQLISDEERQCQEYQRRDKFVSDDKNIVRAHQLHLLASEPFRSATGTKGQKEPMKLVSPRCSTCFVFKTWHQGNGTKATDPRQRNQDIGTQGNGTKATEPGNGTQCEDLWHRNQGTEPKHHLSFTQTLADYVTYLIQSRQPKEWKPLARSQVT